MSQSRLLKSVSQEFQLNLLELEVLNLRIHDQGAARGSARGPWFATPLWLACAVTNFSLFLTAAVLDSLTGFTRLTGTWELTHLLH